MQPPSIIKVPRAVMSNVITTRDFSCVDSGQATKFIQSSKLRPLEKSENSNKKFTFCVIADRVQKAFRALDVSLYIPRLMPGHQCSFRELP